MCKISKSILLLCIFLLFALTLIGCNENSNDRNSSIEQFTNELKDKNYKFEVKEVDKDFLSGNRKRIVFGNEAVDVYLYKNDSEMEKDARRIDSHGSSYTNGSKVIMVSWISFPHFYKKDNIIVQYVGENDNIISDLKDIFGEQFAGYK